MIGLAKQGRALRVPEDFNIDWVIEDDILDFNSLGQGFSWTVDLPIKGNEWAFHHASDPARSGNKLKTYDGFQITWGGNLWWEVSVTLRNVSGENYRIDINTIPSELLEKRDTLISEIVTTSIAIPDGSYAATIGAINNNNANPMKFPMIHFYNDRTRFPAQATSGDPVPIFRKGSTITLHEPVINSTSGYNYIPFFRLKYIVRQALDAIGYTLVDNFSDSNTDKIFIHSNRPLDMFIQAYSNPECDFSKIDNTIVVSKYLPELTLFELLKDLCFYTSSSIQVDLNEKKLIVSNIERDTATVSQKLDVSTKCHPRLESDDPDITNIELDYDLDSDLYQVIEPEGTDRGSFDEVSNFEAISTPTDKDYGFVKSINAYMRLVEYDTSSYAARRYTHPYWPKKTGSEKLSTLTPTMKPHPLKSNYTYKIYDVNYELVDNGSGKIQIDGKVDCNAGDKIGLIFEDHEGPIDHLFTPYTVDTVTAGSVDLNEDMPAGDYKLKHVIVAESAGSWWFPVADAEQHYPEQDIINQGYKGGVVLWHGSITYPKAFSDGYNPDGSNLATFSLDTQGTYSIWVSKWKAVYDFINTTRTITLRTFLRAIDLRRLAYRVKQLRFRQGVIRYRRIKVTLGKTSSSQEVEGYRL